VIKELQRIWFFDHAEYYDYAEYQDGYVYRFSTIAGARVLLVYERRRRVYFHRSPLLSHRMRPGIPFRQTLDGEDEFTFLVLKETYVLYPSVPQKGEVIEKQQFDPSYQLKKLNHAHLKILSEELHTCGVQTGEELHSRVRMFPPCCETLYLSINFLYLKETFDVATLVPLRL
jgi:hypothetical protein